MEELWRLALEGVADELENPSDEEQSERIQPQSVEEEACDKKGNREQNGRDAQSVAHPVHRVLMTGRILRDPLLVAASAQHAQDDITPRLCSPVPDSSVQLHAMGRRFILRRSTGVQHEPTGWHCARSRS